MILTQHLKLIARTPALKLAVTAHKELLDLGFTDDLVMVGSDHQAIYASLDGKPAGVITFTVADWASQIDIWLGYVVPTCRFQGVYRAMWEALCDQGRSHGIKVIMGNTAPENARMRDVAKALGRREVAVVYRFDL